MSLKVTLVKKILDSCNNGVLKKNYRKKLEKYGSDLFFECNFDEKDIRTCLKNNLFLRDILLAWRKLNKKDAILCFGQEIIWNNTHIRANEKINYVQNMVRSWYKKSETYMAITRRYFALFASYVTCTIYHLMIF